MVFWQHPRHLHPPGRRREGEHHGVQHLPGQVQKGARKFFQTTFFMYLWQFMGNHTTSGVSIPQGGAERESVMAFSIYQVRFRKELENFFNGCIDFHENHYTHLFYASDKKNIGHSLLGLPGRRRERGRGGARQLL